MVQRDLSLKVKLLIYQSVYAPTLNCNHKLMNSERKNEVVDTSVVSYKGWLGCLLREGEE